MDKLKAWFKNSTTILWARLQVAGGALVAAAVSLKDNPEIQSALHTVLQPSYIPYYIIGIGLVTEVARRRSIEK